MDKLVRRSVVLPPHRLRLAGQGFYRPAHTQALNDQADEAETRGRVSVLIAELLTEWHGNDGFEPRSFLLLLDQAESDCTQIASNLAPARPTSTPADRRRTSPARPSERAPLPPSPSWCRGNDDGIIERLPMAPSETRSYKTTRHTRCFSLFAHDKQPDTTLYASRQTPVVDDAGLDRPLVGIDPVGRYRDPDAFILEPSYLSALLRLSHMREENIEARGETTMAKPLRQAVSPLTNHNRAYSLIAHRAGWCRIAVTGSTPRPCSWTPPFPSSCFA